MKKSSAQYRAKLKKVFGDYGFDAVIEKDFVTVFHRDSGKSISFDSPMDAERWLARHVRGENPVPPSSRLRALDRLPAHERREYDRAAKLFADFTGHDARPMGYVDAPVAPRVALVVGFCDGVLYTTVRDGKQERYIHEFAKRDRPMLLASPDGKQLMLYGGNYRFTERGIVDRSDKSR